MHGDTHNFSLSGSSRLVSGWRTTALCSLTAILVLGLSHLAGQPANAYGCLLDSNNNGQADTGIDGNDATTGNHNDRLACGSGAQATSQFGVALGDGSQAGEEGTAVGNFAEATGFASVAVGIDAQATGLENTTLGFDASAFSPHTNATALGSRARVEQNNALVLGSINGINEATADTDVGIGTTRPDAPLHIRRSTESSIILEQANQSATWSLIHESGVAGAFKLDHTVNDVADGDEFVVEPNGDVRIGGTLAVSSDKAAKQDIESFDGARVLAKLDQVPVSEWSYKSDKETRHIGPMAQDFHKVFGLGSSDKHISPTDMAGVNMAAIKAQQHRIRKLEAAQAEKDAEIAALKQRLAAIEAQLQ